MQESLGTLYLVATPIGNLGDLSERARKVLEEVDLVACEDTRRSGQLLQHLGLRRRLVSLHEHNEHRRIPELVETLAGGRSVAVLSDAGTPLLNDPGYPLTRAAIAAGARVVAVPGPSAILAALVSSGLPPYPFTFHGFPPRKAGRRRTFFEQLAALDHTHVFFESPHRLLATLDTARHVLGEERTVAVCRELTKLHEEILRGSLAAVHDQLESRERVRGEVVVVLGPGDPAGPAPGSDDDLDGAEDG